LAVVSSLKLLAVSYQTLDGFEVCRNEACRNEALASVWLTASTIYMDLCRLSSDEGGLTFGSLDWSFWVEQPFSMSNVDSRTH
jgi:hypothetical protein